MRSMFFEWQGRTTYLVRPVRLKNPENEDLMCKEGANDVSRSPRAAQKFWKCGPNVQRRGERHISFAPCGSKILKMRT